MTSPLPPPRARLTTLPNMLGLVRIGATPVVVALLLLPFPGGGLIAWAIFAVASATDWFDGRIARARGQVTPLGVFMDLTADKVLVAGSLIAMVEIGLLPAWIVATLLIRELVVQGMRQLAASDNVVIPARILGKYKAFGTNLAVGVLLLAFDAQTGGPLAGLGITGAMETLGYWMAVAITALSVVSGLAYLRDVLPLLMGRRD
ncbi:MAG TPA: CDP-diacylglycerol--glycerol-3-phosphate 3-phosphatidyltransferase [Candidatus Limnocylindria bacterium]|nr:CDP-diacylglycerol--glycerol-3-phosphate 3-phosphatidyltransferase [Candidatus Limnocylindria bacterium]